MCLQRFRAIWIEKFAPQRPRTSPKPRWWFVISSACLTTSLASQHRCGPARETAVVRIPCCYFANAASHSQGVPACDPNRILVLHTGCGRSFDGGKSWKHPVPAYACGRRLVVRQSYGETCCPLRASEYANQRYQRAAFIALSLAAPAAFHWLRVSRCGHRLYKTMFGFPSGACYVCGELGVAKCRASRSSEHSCKEKCSRFLCFCCSFSFACLCALGS